MRRRQQPLAAYRGVSFRFSLPAVVFSFGAVSGLACRPDEASQRDAGPPGGALDGGNVIHQGATGSDVGDAGADAAARGLAPDPTLACVEYIRGLCEQTARCEGHGDADIERCMGSARHCPDVMYAPGSTRTVAATLACADDWRVLACDSELARPACATPGTRAAGEPCIAAMQCASLSCTAYGDSCGVCRELVGEGEACDLEAGLGCADGFVCSSTESPVCERYEPPDTTPARALGEECDRNSGTSCYPNDCRPDSEGVARCQPYPALDESCSETLTCAFGNSYCDTSQRCTAFPPIGAGCGVDAFTGAARWCGPDAACVGTAPGPRTCEALPGPGEACSSTCAADVACECDDTECETSHCTRWRYPGDSCSATGDRCLVGACAGGLCLGGSERGLYEIVCGP
jgi:hypothetical protein